MNNFSNRKMESATDEREATKAKFGTLFTEMEKLFLKWDPMGVDYSHLNGRLDEYAPEVGTILPRIHTEAEGEEDVYRILVEEFTLWFSEFHVQQADRVIKALVPAVWRVWCKFPEFHCS